MNTDRMYDEFGSVEVASIRGSFWKRMRSGDRPGLQIEPKKVTALESTDWLGRIGAIRPIWDDLGRIVPVKLPVNFSTCKGFEVG